MKRFKLTKAAKLLIVIVVLALVGVGVWGGLKTGFVKTDNEKIMASLMDKDGNVINTEKTSKDTINLSLDEWIG